MADTDLIKLYSQRILALAADIPHAERLTSADASVMKRSPLCGSTVTVDVRAEAGTLSDLGMDVKACALGQASASILGRAAIGASGAELAAGRDALRALLKEGAAVPQGRFAEIEVLTPAREHKNRHASILLAWDAVVEALAKAEQPLEQQA
ncbi:MAG: iron-sulfur cluster assembly scaffold protein [Pseudomonadota bacterium]